MLHDLLVEIAVVCVLHDDAIVAFWQYNKQLDG